MRSATTLHPIETGVDLLLALDQLSRRGEAWIDGTGHLEAVELRVAGEANDPVRALRGRYTLLHLAGPSGGPYAATLARATDGGIEVRGGMIVRARSAGVTVAVHASTAAAPTAVARGSSIEDRPRDRRDDPVPPAAAAAQGPPAPMWARVAAANAAARELDADDEDEVDPAVPEAGDLVEHFAFGICDVLTAEGERLRIRDVNSPGRVREVSLEMLTVMGPTAGEGGKRLFRLVRRPLAGR
jgi:hypothetical protein